LAASKATARVIGDQLDDCGVNHMDGHAMTIRELETRLNLRLKEIHRDYAVKNLRRLPSGEYWFDLATTFKGRHMAKVNRLFADLLSQAPRRLARPSK
jgi:hypothetical protein